jgi:heat shock protein HslJ
MRAFVSILVLLFSACAPKNASKTPDPAPFLALRWADLAGPAFTLQALSVNGKPVPLPASRRPTIQFDVQGQASGMAGVNRYSVEAVLDGKNGITWAGPAVTTKMAGPAEAMALENAFLAALQSATRLAMQGSVLKLNSKDDSTRLEFGR